MPSMNSQFSSWILDNGATDHVTHDFSLFFSFHFIKPLSVNLPNGTTASARYCGCVKLSNNLWLYNVLYIPEFKFNIISIPQLVTNLNCKLIFHKSFCDIQIPGHAFIEDDWAC